MMDGHGGVRSRRDFLHALTGVVALGALPVSALAVSPTRGRDGGPAGAAFGGHPEPRPGIDGSSVLDPGTVREDLAGTFEGIRAIPHIADGIGCHCGCGAMPEMRSLLSCYEGAS